MSAPIVKFNEPDVIFEPPKSIFVWSIAADALMSAFTITPVPIAAVPLDAIVISPLTSLNT